MYCEYKNIFGEPNKGVHSYRIFDIAIVDVGATILLGIVLHNATNKKFKLYKIIISLFILGIILHRLFCVRTTVDKLLFALSP